MLPINFENSDIKYISVLYISLLLPSQSSLYLSWNIRPVSMEKVELCPKTFIGFVVLAGDSIHLDRDSTFSQKDFPFLFPQKSVKVNTSYNGNRSGKNKVTQNPFHVFIIPAVKWGWPSPLSFVTCHEMHAWKLIYKHHPNPTKPMKKNFNNFGGWVWIECSNTNLAVIIILLFLCISLLNIHIKYI